MSQGWFALLGVLVGALPTLLGLWIQQRFQNKNLRQKLAMKIAIIDYENILKRPGEQNVAPIASFYLHHLSIIDLAYKGKLTKEALEKVLKENEELAYTFPGAPLKDE